MQDDLISVFKPGQNLRDAFIALTKLDGPQGRPAILDDIGRPIRTVPEQRAHRNRQDILSPPKLDTGDDPEPVAEQLPVGGVTTEGQKDLDPPLVDPQGRNLRYRDGLEFA